MTPAPLPLGLTMGDAAGIGPEIIAKAISTTSLTRPLVLLGDPALLQAAIMRWGEPLRPKLMRPDDPMPTSGVAMIETTRLDPAPVPGKIAATCGQAAYDSLSAGIALAKAGRLAGLVTAPLHKEALAAAGIPFPGHTEILASQCGVDVAMMLVSDHLRTVLVTVHCALREAIARADFSAQKRAIRFAQIGGQALGITKPRIAVAGLNPHAGEGGLFGTEESDIIQPAVEAARADGLDVTGPYPGDTVFLRAKEGAFDIVVAQYHDQGLIPVKYLGLDQGVNVTLGLPFVRTSPDHGTAFDIAGTGQADPRSFKAAIMLADRMATATTPRLDQK